MSNSMGGYRKSEDAYPTGTPGPCSKFLVESELIYFCFSVFHVWSLSLDFILFISARILVPLITPATDHRTYTFFLRL